MRAETREGKRMKEQGMVGKSKEQGMVEKMEEEVVEEEVEKEEGSTLVP